jgi:hypothetical protein
MIPRANGRIDVTDASLTDWDKDRTLMPGFAAEPPSVPFADIYLTWHPNGLYLATIGMDYVNPADLSYEDSFPLSETYQLHLLVLIRGQAYHFAVHFMPEDENADEYRRDFPLPRTGNVLERRNGEEDVWTIRKVASGSACLSRGL